MLKLAKHNVLNTIILIYHMANGELPSAIVDVRSTDPIAAGEVDFSNFGSILGTTQTDLAGLHFEVSQAESVTIEAEFFEFTELSELYLRDVTANTVITSTLITASVESVSASLDASKTYALVADNGGSSYSRYQTDQDTNLPTTNNILTVTTGRFGTESDDTFTDTVYNIKRITVR